MIAKIILLCLLATAALAMPVDDDDLPTYTEKVTPEKPTQAPKFGAKKVRTTEHAPHHAEAQQPYALSPQRTTLVPRATLKASKPLRASSRPVGRTDKVLRRPEPLSNDLSPGNEYDAPAFVPAHELGVEYDSDGPERHNEYGLVDEYEPRRVHGRPEETPRAKRHRDEEAPRAEHYRAEEAPRAEHYRAEEVPRAEHYRAEEAPRAEHYRAEEAPRAEHYRAEEAPRAEHYRAEETPRAEHYRAPAPPARELRRSRHVDVPSDYGSAVGNAPQLRYAPAPERFGAANGNDEPDYGYTGNSYEDRPQPYIFGYELKDESGSTQSRKEEGDDYGNKRGSYGYTDGHGVYRQVEYVADAHGFRAVIRTNEPGTESQDPADVQMLSEAGKY